VSIVDTPQWIEGMAVEKFLDKFFAARGWEIFRTTPRQERGLCLGDRLFVKGKWHYFVEYKSGMQTAVTGNIFLETISVDAAGRPGWVYTCTADWLMYACLGNGKILVLEPERLRSCIERLKEKFHVAHTGSQNKGYQTHGVVVPLAFAETEIAVQVVTIAPLQVAA